MQRSNSIRGDSERQPRKQNKNPCPSRRRLSRRYAWRLKRWTNKSKADQLIKILKEKAKSKKTGGTKRQEKSRGDSANCYEESDPLGKTMASCNGNGVGSLHVAAENSKCPLLADWKRPDGPTNVWRIVESSGLRFSIQDIPEDRYGEAIKHMSDYFMADEATCKALKLKDDKDAIDDFRKLWDYLLRKGMSVGAFKLEDGDRLGELAGVNILFVFTQEVGHALDNFTKTFKSASARKLFEFMNHMSEKVDVNKMFGVDKYLGALGCSIKPEFRGQKLGLHLLQVRDDIGRKYGITASSTIFTGPASQKQAERAGYEVVLSQEYDQVVDDNGDALFADINAKTCKLMTKELR